MSEPSSNVAGWSSRLEPPRSSENVLFRHDHPRLGDVIVAWRGEPQLLQPGRAILVGFPQDEGVRRNGGRVGAASAPAEIRRWVQRLTPWDGITGVDLSNLPPLDAGNVRISANLEESQAALGEVIAGILESGAVPIVLGGGHETAFGHYLGYVNGNRKAAIVNLDAHLDVRPFPEGRGNSGTPFRQALEHPTHPLAGPHYVCLGVQPHATSRAHWEYARSRDCVLRWRSECVGELEALFAQEIKRLEEEGCDILLTIDADAVDLTNVPGVSAPNVMGLSGQEVIECMRMAGRSSAVKSMELVEINPQFDRDGQSARWAALAIWTFLVGLAERSRH